MPRLSNEDDLDAIGHEVYGEPPASALESPLARARRARAVMSRLRRIDLQRTRPAPLLDRIDEEEGR